MTLCKCVIWSDLVTSSALNELNSRLVGSVVSFKWVRIVSSKCLSVSRKRLSNSWLFSNDSLAKERDLSISTCKSWMVRCNSVF